MNIFITGGSGFVGQRLIRQLVGSGQHVTALARSATASARIAEAGATVCQGDLSTIADWEARLAGQEVVIHAAAPIDVWGDPASMERDIVTASLELYRACQRQQVRRFVHISSEAVMQGAGPLLDIDEQAPYPSRANSYYGQAKQQAERALLQAQAGTELIILRPSFIWGAGAPQLAGLVERVRQGGFVWIGGGKAVIEMVHVDNVVAAVELALTAGQPGGIYWVSDQAPQTARAFLGALLAAAGSPVPTRSIPTWLARGLATLTEALWRGLRLKRTPPVSHFQVDFLALPRRYRTERSQRELGYQPVRTVAEGLREVGAQSA